MIAPAVTLHPGDCLEVLDALPADTFDAAITDPPYHLLSIVKRFCGKESAAAAQGVHADLVERDPEYQANILRGIADLADAVPRCRCPRCPAGPGLPFLHPHRKERPMKLDTIALIATAAFAATMIVAPFVAEAQANICAPRDAVMERLASQYGETRQGIGLAANNADAEEFASAETVIQGDPA
jgi:hypothetical protein